MFDWDQDIDDLTAQRSVARPVAPVAAPPGRGRIRRALVTLGLPLVVVGALFAAPGLAPARSDPAMASFGLSRLSMDTALPDGLLSYDQAQYDNFRRGIQRFSDSELLAFAAATRRDQANPRLTLASWDLDALRLADLEIARRGLVARAPVATLRPVSTLTPAI